MLKAKCPNCGQIVELNKMDEASICSNCGKAFVTKRALIQSNGEQVIMHNRDKIKSIVLIFVLLSCLIMLIVFPIVIRARIAWRHSIDDTMYRLFTAIIYICLVLIAVIYRHAIQKFKITNLIISLSDLLLSLYFFILCIVNFVCALKYETSLMVNTIGCLVVFVTLCVPPIIKLIKTKHICLDKPALKRNISCIGKISCFIIVIAFMIVSPLIQTTRQITEAKSLYLLDRLHYFDYGVETSDELSKDLIQAGKNNIRRNNRMPNGFAKDGYRISAVYNLDSNRNFTIAERRAVINSEFISLLYNNGLDASFIIYACNKLNLTTLELQIGNTAFRINELADLSNGEIDNLVDIINAIKDKQYSPQVLATDILNHSKHIKEDRLDIWTKALGKALAKNPTTKNAFTQECVDIIDNPLISSNVCNAIGLNTSNLCAKYKDGYITLNLYGIDYGKHILSWFKSYMKNPDSLNIYSVMQYISTTKEGANIIYFEIDYSGTNSFGGTIRDTIYLSFSSFATVTKENSIPNIYTFDSFLNL